MALAIALKKAGRNDFIMLERASDIGGVWRDNAYPGAACDVVSRFYSFSYDQTYKWSEAFASAEGDLGLSTQGGRPARHTTARAV